MTTVSGVRKVSSATEPIQHTGIGDKMDEKKANNFFANI